MSKSTFLDVAGNLCERRKDGSLSVKTVNDLPSKTIQSDKDGCDVNLILKKFRTTGVMTNLAQRTPLSGDFSQTHSYHDAMNAILAAQESFQALPAGLRKRFSNDPGQFVNFLDDPSNLPEAIRLGLVSDPQASRVPQGSESDPIPASKEAG